MAFQSSAFQNDTFQKETASGVRYYTANPNRFGTCFATHDPTIAPTAIVTQADGLSARAVRLLIARSQRAKRDEADMTSIISIMVKSGMIQ